jgi:hypothetical protein
MHNLIGIKAKKESGTNTGNRLFPGIVAVCKMDGQSKNEQLN